MSGPGSSPWFISRDGSRELTGDWDAGNHVVTAKALASDVATGTAPLSVASTTAVPNLNADLLDGNHASAFATAAQATALEAKYRVNVEKDSSTITLTASATKVLLASATLDDFTSSGDWELYDSGSGSADSLRYTAAATISGWFAYSFNIKHTSADSKPLNFRAYPYQTTTLKTHSIVYGATSTINSEIVTCERTMYVAALAQNDYLTLKAAYVNTGGGGSTNGRIEPFGCTISFIQA
jgi:hypothetical protein